MGKPDFIERHQAIKSTFSLGKKENSIIKFEKERTSFLPILLAIAFCAAIAVFFWFALQKSDEHADAIATERYLKAIQDEDARRSIIQFAKVGFLDSFPPNVTISDESGMLYAKNEDGSYSELRTRKKSWIHNIPVKEDTIRRFRFNTEGFHELSKTIAYYDWYPTRDKEEPLQKVYTHLELAPKTSKLLDYCKELSSIPAYTNACRASIFKELMGRQYYEDAIAEWKKTQEQPKTTAQSTTNPSLSQTPLPPPAPAPSPEISFSPTKPFPEKLQGEIRIHTDTPETKVFFMGEPLMITKENGSMVQVRVQPEAPYVFSTFGNEKPIYLTDKLSIRLEAPGLPPYITEILTHQWHCTPVSLEEALQMEIPTYLQNDNTLVHLQHLCRYSIDISVSFAKIKALSERK